MRDDPTATKYEVYVGRHDITSNEGQSIGVDQIVPHPSAPEDPEPGDGPGGDNDIALLHLASAVLGPVSRLTAPARVAEIGAGSSTTVLGWGSLTNGIAYSDTLQQVTLDTIGVGTSCSDVSNYDNITPNEICIGDLAGGRDSCLGDSGGPALVQRDGEWFLLGVVSWGTGCAVAGYPGVYTFVPSYFDWILSVATDAPPQSYLPSSQILAVISG